MNVLLAVFQKDRGNSEERGLVIITQFSFFMNLDRVCVETLNDATYSTFNKAIGFNTELKINCCKCG